jgi:hypothetical protein
MFTVLVYSTVKQIMSLQKTKCKKTVFLTWKNILNILFDVTLTFLITFLLIKSFRNVIVPAWRRVGALIKTRPRNICIIKCLMKASTQNILLSVERTIQIIRDILRTGRDGQNVTVTFVAFLSAVLKAFGTKKFSMSVYRLQKILSF